MKKIILFIFGLVILGSSLSQAQNNLPDNFYFKKLSNGLDVLVIQDKTVPLATIEIAVRNGAYTESPEFDGLSHLYEHMFFKANKDIPSQEEFLKRTQELGAIWNGTTSTERVNYFITIGTQHIRDGLKFMNSAIRYPLFIEQEMKNENPVVDGEFQRAESNPAFFLFNDMNRYMWGDLYSRKNVIGDHDIILTATPEKMRILQEKYYYPNNSIIVIGGDVDPYKTFDEVEQIFGDWQSSDFDPFERYPIPEFAPLKESKNFITINENAKNPMIMIDWHGPDTRTDIPATYAADVFSFIVNQTTSELQKDLIDGGLANTVNVGYQTQKYVGPISIFIIPKPDKINEVLAKINEHIERWDSDDYFTEEQIETAKTQLAIGEAYGEENITNFVHTVTFWWASASIDYYTGYLENLNKVTREDMKNYVRKYIKGKPRITGILLSPQMKESFTLENFETAGSH